MTLMPPLDGDFEDFRQLLLQELGLPAYDETPSQELLQRWFVQGYFAYKAQSDPDIAELINNTASAVRAALNATYETPTGAQAKADAAVATRETPAGAQAKADGARDEVLAQKGADGGLAPLDSAGLLPDARVPTRLTSGSLTTTIKETIRVASGQELCTPAEANTMVQVQVTFPADRFTAAPFVVLTPGTTANAQIFAYVSNRTTSGFTINFRRDTATGTNVNWIAVQQ